MNIFAWLSLTSLVATIVLGIVVYTKNPKNVINRFFLFLCMFLSYWAFAEFGFLQADNLDSTIFWIKASSFWPILISIMMHFVLIFTEKSKWLKNKVIFFSLYAPAVIFSLLFLITNSHIPIKEDWGWVQYDINPLLSNISNIWFSGLAILIIYLLFRYYFKVVVYRTKKQAKYMLIGFFIPIIISILSIYLLGEFYIPDFTSTGIVIGCVFIGNGIWKYGLFTISPTTAADTIISTMSDALVLTESNGKITSVNQAALKLLGWEKSKVIGQTFEFISTCPFDEINKKEVISDLETGFKTKNGKNIPISLSASTLRGKKRELHGFVLIGRDITERKKMEEALQKKNEYLEQMNVDLNSMNQKLTATNEELIVTQQELEKSKEQIQKQNVKLKKLDQLKSAFLNITSHELRTPMSSIKGYVQMLLKQVLGDIGEEQKSALEIVLRNTNRLDHLIQDILDISRLESGTMKFIPEPTNIKDMINEIAETMKSSAEIKNIKINVDIIGEIPDLIIDQDRIKQVIINLFNNAIKYSPEGTFINICGSADNTNVLFEVQDYGRGIPEDKQKHVFETFYQVDSGMDRKFGGAGLGLSISRGIILAHGGNIWVESEGIGGKGSTFKFSLPVKPVQDVEGRFKRVDVFRLEDTKNWFCTK